MERDRRKEISEWVARAILPCEHLVRAWLARSLVAQADIDDLIQEAYCRIASIDSIESIARPDGFFFQIVRNLLLNQVRHARLIRIETVAELDDLAFRDPAPSPEEATGAKRDLERVRLQIDALPERCRDVFRLRRVEGLSQRDIAERLGISENVVEYETARGLKLVIKALRQNGDDITDNFPRTKLR